MDKRATILIAEDGLASGEVVKNSLERKNFAVELVEDGESALSIYKQAKP